MKYQSNWKVLFYPCTRSRGIRFLTEQCQSVVASTHADFFPFTTLALEVLTRNK